MRTFRRLENIFTLCVMAYVYATWFLRKAKGFKRILKYLSDNLETVSTKTHALLAGIRALVNEARIRFISGRPRKRTVDDRQMALPGFLTVRTSPQKSPKRIWGGAEIFRPMFSRVS